MQLQSIIIELGTPTFQEVQQYQQDLPTEILHIVKHTAEPDILILTPLDQKYTVKDAQRIVEWNTKKPFNSEFKIAVIEYADILSAESQNKLLKTIEEPSRNTLIMLLARNPAKFLDTILSRCQQFVLRTNQKERHDELAQRFIDSHSIIERHQLTEKILKNENAHQITKNIIVKIGELAIQQNDFPISPEDFLTINHANITNPYNLRLTLEAIAIMLKQ